MNRFAYMIFTGLICFLGASFSDATVIFVDGFDSGTASNNSFTEGTIGPTSGDEGDFELLFCATTSTGPNMFLDATPNWDLLNTGGCSGGPDCISGIWQKFSPLPNNLSTTCAWTEPTLVFGGIVFRYGGADPDLPVISVDCNTGTSDIAASPPIFTEAGSMVVRVFIADELIDLSFQELPGTEALGKARNNLSAFGNTINQFAYNEPFANAGMVPSVLIPFEVVDTNWRACTIAIRMEGSTPFVAQVPALNEWGLLSFAALAGITCIFFMRRRVFGS